MTLSLAQVLEAKLKPRDTASAAEPKKIKLIGVNFTPISYDFERKRKTGGSGFTTENLGMSFNSDLLPGFNADVQYSLFQGSVLSDTSKFKPFRTGINASFSINGNSGIFGALTRIFGRAVPTGAPQTERLGQGPTMRSSSALRRLRLRARRCAISSLQFRRSRTWQASFTFSSTRQRAAGWQRNGDRRRSA